jgi:hypothetical protein
MYDIAWKASLGTGRNHLSSIRQCWHFGVAFAWRLGRVV